MTNDKLADKLHEIAALLKEETRPSRAVRSALQLTERLQSVIEREAVQNALAASIARVKERQTATMDELLTILRAEKDAEGHKVVDKFFDINISQVYVELPSGGWRVYSTS